MNHLHTDTAVDATGTGMTGVDDPDAPVPVAVGELLEWGWLAGQLAGWLATAGEATAAEFARCFPHGPGRQQAAWMLDHIAERVGALLDNEAGQP